MVAKLWKKIGLTVLIIACLFNVITKIVKKLSFEDELEGSAQYILQQEKNK